MSTRTSVRSLAYGSKRIGTMAARRQLARQAVIAGRRTTLSLYPSRPGLRGAYSRTEVKSFDTIVTQGNLTTINNITGTEPGTGFGGIAPLNEIRQGSALYNRIGSKVVARSLQIRADVALSGSSDNLGASVRYLIIYDRQANGAFPTYSTIFANNGTAPTSGTGYAGINMANRSRFTILRDRIVTMQMGQNLIYTMNEFVPLNHEIEFKSDAGTIDDIATGAFYLVAFYVNVTGTSPLVAMANVNARLRYFD